MFCHRGVAQLGLERLLWEQEAVSSNLTAPMLVVSPRFARPGINYRRAGESERPDTFKEGDGCGKRKRRFIFPPRRAVVLLGRGRAPIARGIPRPR